MPKATTPTLPLAQVRRVLRTEMTKFFTRLRTPEPARDGMRAWPAVPDQEFIDALADSLLDSGKAAGMGVAHLQTLVHELQDRINSEISKG